MQPHPLLLNHTANAALDLLKLKSPVCIRYEMAKCLRPKERYSSWNLANLIKENQITATHFTALQIKGYNPPKTKDRQVS